MSSGTMHGSGPANGNARGDSAQRAARHALDFLRLMKWELWRLAYAVRWPLALWLAACLLAVFEYAAFGYTSYDEDPAFILGLVASSLMAGRVLLVPLFALCGKGTALERDGRFPLWQRMAAGLASMVVALFAVCFLVNFLLEAVVDFGWFYSFPLTAEEFMRGTRKLCGYLFDVDTLAVFLYIGVLALPLGCSAAFGWVAAGSLPGLRQHRVLGTAGITLLGIVAYSGMVTLFLNHSNTLRRLLGIPYGVIQALPVLLALAASATLVAATVLLHQKWYEPA